MDHPDTDGAECDPFERGVTMEMLDGAPPSDDGGGVPDESQAPIAPNDGGGFSNFYEITDGDGPKARRVRIGYDVRTLHKALEQLTDCWPRAANAMLFTKAADGQPLWIRSATEFMAWIAGQVKSDPLQNNLRWAGGEDKVTQQIFHAYTVQNAQQYDAVEAFPHYPRLEKHYYLHPPLKPRPLGAFDALLKFFRPATPVDRDLIAAAWMTPFAGIGHGTRPAFLIQAKDDDAHGGRGAGKTTMVELIGRLLGGCIELSAGDEWEKVKTRLLSPAALTKRIALLDNVKTLRFSWAEFEAAITTEVISGRALYIGEGRRVNSLTYFLTLNGANLSKDMAQRCVPIMLDRPTYDAGWEERIVTLIETRRWDIISDIVNILSSPAEPLRRYSRWSAWEKAVLSRVVDPSECQRVIADRQAAIDDDQSGADAVREGFRLELTQRGHDPDTEIVWIPSKTAAKWVNAIENEERRPFNRAMAHLYNLGVSEIRRSNRNGRGCTWTGPNADQNRPAVTLIGQH